MTLEKFLLTWIDFGRCYIWRKGDSPPIKLSMRSVLELNASVPAVAN